MMATVSRATGRPTGAIGELSGNAAWVAMAATRGSGPVLRSASARQASWK